MKQNRDITLVKDCGLTKRENCALYRELAILAPNEESHRILLEMSDEDRVCAEMFETLYYEMTGRRCVHEAAFAPRLNGSYRDHLTDQLINERRYYGTYGDHYLNARHPRFRDAYYRAHTGSNLHTLGLLYLLTLL